MTESALVGDETRVSRQLRQIREAGIRVAIDDFGTGYSSLSYLQKLPADIIKIDQSFIRTLTSNERGQALVRAMIEMARSLDLRTVAEGIEDEPAADLLRSWSCDEAQGFLFARSMPSADVMSWMARPARNGGEQVQPTA